MTEEWRRRFRVRFPIPRASFDQQHNIEDFISQQRKEAAREALEAAAREMDTSEIGHQQDDDTIWCKLDDAVKLIRKHIEEL